MPTRTWSPLAMPLPATRATTAPPPGSTTLTPSPSLPAPVPVLSGRKVLLGVRPEHLVPATDGFPIQVELVEALGADMLIHGRAGKSGVIARLPDGAHPEYGSTLVLGFAPERMHWFDPGTGQRIAP